MKKIYPYRVFLLVLISLLMFSGCALIDSMKQTKKYVSIHEMADAMAGVKDKAVLIKNPTHPELGLWIGAFERFYRAGVRDLAAIHRGFSTIDKSKFRNVPTWSIPIELKRIAPQIPIICDPSHIGGKRDLIFEISQIISSRATSRIFIHQ